MRSAAKKTWRRHALRWACVTSLILAAGCLPAEEDDDATASDAVVAVNDAPAAADASVPDVPATADAVLADATQIDALSDGVSPSDIGGWDTQEAETWCDQFSWACEAYDVDIKSRLTNYGCLNAGCHSAHGPAAGLDLSTAESMMTGGAGGPVLYECNPDASPLIQKLLPNPAIGVQMPLGGTPVSQEEIDYLSSWVFSVCST